MRKGIPVLIGTLVLTIGIITAFSSLSFEDIKKINYTYEPNQSLMSEDPFDDLTCEQPYIKTEQEIQRETKIKEVVEVWRTFLDQGNAPTDDPRRRDLYSIASCVVDATDYYMVNEVEGIGGKLPSDGKAHIVVATVIVTESGISHKVRGTRGEIGLMQVWGEALGKFSLYDVIQNPELQIISGVRWLAHQNQICRSNNWVKILSSYGAGPKAYERGKGCREMAFAKYKYGRALSYMAKVDKTLD